MSDSIGKVGNTNAVASTAAASQAQLNSLAEVQAYNVKAIGANRVMGNGEQGIPLGASLNAYAGDTSTPASASSTRSLLAGGSAGFPDPNASSTETPTMSVPPPSNAGNPWQQPTPAATAPNSAPTQDPFLQSTPAQAPAAAPTRDPFLQSSPAPVAPSTPQTQDPFLQSAPAPAPIAQAPAPSNSGTVPGAPTITFPGAPPTITQPAPPTDVPYPANGYNQPQFTPAPPPNASAAPDPFMQQSSVSGPGNPWAQPSPASAATPSAPYASPSYAPQNQPTLQSQSVARIDATSDASSTSSKKDDKDKKEAWHLDSVPQNERDFALDSPLDDRSQDTWSPTANRSKEFAALDTTKLTSPEEALAEWRAQQEATASAIQTTASLPPPEQASTPAPQQASAPTPVAMQQASASLPTSPRSDAFTAAQVPSTPGNPWMAPSPGAAPASQAVPSMTGPSAPVDLSAGGYNNPNLSGHASVLSSSGADHTSIPPQAMYNTPTPPVDQSVPFPNVYPYMSPQGFQGTQGSPNPLPALVQNNVGPLGPMGPQGMFQTRYNALSMNLNPATSMFDDKSDDDDDDSDEKSSDIMGASPILMQARAEQAAQQAGYGNPMNPAAMPPGVVGPALSRRLNGGA